MKQKSKVHTERNFQEVSIVACVQYRNTESHTYNEHDLSLISRDVATSWPGHPSPRPRAGYSKLSNGSIHYPVWTTQFHEDFWTTICVGLGITTMRRHPRTNPRRSRAQHVYERVAAITDESSDEVRSRADRFESVGGCGRRRGGNGTARCCSLARS